jgi:hypothetical protein
MLAEVPSQGRCVLVQLVESVVATVPLQTQDPETVHLATTVLYSCWTEKKREEKKKARQAGYEAEDEVVIPFFNLPPPANSL